MVPFPDDSAHAERVCSCELLVPLPPDSAHRAASGIAVFRAETPNLCENR